MEYGETLRAEGYVQGRSNPCLFHHAELGVSILVHGDDFVAVGPEKHLESTRRTLEDKYKLKVEVLGRGEGKKAEVRILNKIVRHTKEGIELEADPRHAELVVKELEIENAKPSAVPGTKESSKTTQSKTDEKDPEEKMSTATRARIELRNINNIQEARNSAGDKAWNDGELKYDGDDDEVEEEPLDAQQARLYRGVAARLNYIAPDRPDISYAVKEAARNMSCPKPSDLRRLRNIGKYLLGQPRLI